VGSGGSSRIRSAILQVIVNVLDFHMPVADAITAPRIHFEEDALQAEGDIPAKAVDELRTWGYNVTHWPGHNMYFGGAHTVAMEDGHLVAAGDPRRGGSVAVV
jgi:gamma-glutamyltranspeptidase/glutathione hydrolase